MKKLALFIVGMLLVSCTSNKMVKNWGGTSTINVEENYRVVNVTWKETNLWILTEKMETPFTPRTLYFTEKSSFGIIQGTIIFNEKCTIKK